MDRAPLGYSPAGWFGVVNLATRDMVWSGESLSRVYDRFKTADAAALALLTWTVTGRHGVRFDPKYYAICEVWTDARGWIAPVLTSATDVARWQAVAVERRTLAKKQRARREARQRWAGAR